MLLAVKEAQKLRFKVYMKAAADPDFEWAEFMPGPLRRAFLVHKSAPRLLISLKAGPDRYCPPRLMQFSDPRFLN